MLKIKKFWRTLGTLVMVVTSSVALLPFTAIARDQPATAGVARSTACGLSGQPEEHIRAASVFAVPALVASDAGHD